MLLWSLICSLCARQCCSQIQSDRNRGARQKIQSQQNVATAHKQAPLGVSKKERKNKISDQSSFSTFKTAAQFHMVWDSSLIASKIVYAALLFRGREKDAKDRGGGKCQLSPPLPALAPWASECRVKWCVRGSASFWGGCPRSSPAPSAEEDVLWNSTNFPTAFVTDELKRYCSSIATVFLSPHTTLCVARDNEFAPKPLIVPSWQTEQIRNVSSEGGQCLHFSIVGCKSTHFFGKLSCLFYLFFPLLP